MGNNRRVFDLWFEIMRAELEALARVPVTSRTATEIPPAASAYRSQLLLEGRIHGVMYVTASASSLVQLAQMVVGEQVDPKAAWTEEGLEVWQIWLTAASGKLAVQLSEEIGDDAKNACTILLQGTTAVDGMDSYGGAETTASGSAIRELMLQAGEAEFAFSVSAQVMFPGDEVPPASADQPGIEKTTQEPVETVPQAESSSEVNAEPPLLKAVVAPSEDPETAKPAETQARVEPLSASRTSEEVPAQDQNPYTEPRTKQRLDLLLDIELEATLRFGALELPLREVLELGPGDVLPLDRHVREPVELVVGDRIVAKGEVVLVGGNFALHVTEVAEPRRRLETIRCLF